MTAGDIRAQLFARIERAANALIRQDREAADGKVINRFVEQVAANADGLPIYVELVVDDILAQRFRLLYAADARQLPRSWSPAQRSRPATQPRAISTATARTI
jgi:hypothetical protein